MDMSIMTQNLKSLQSTLAMSNLRRAMNVETAAAASILQDMQVANPAPATQGLGDMLDLRA